MVVHHDHLLLMMLFGICLNCAVELMAGALGMSEIFLVVLGGSQVVRSGAAPYSG